MQPNEAIAAPQQPTGFAHFIVFYRKFTAVLSVMIVPLYMLLLPLPAYLSGLHRVEGRAIYQIRDVPILSQFGGGLILLLLVSAAMAMVLLLLLIKLVTLLYPDRSYSRSDRLFWLALTLEIITLFAITWPAARNVIGWIVD